MELVIKESILKEIENQKNVYLSDSSRVIADYNNEVETVKEYNGRQLLELLQNADDENSSEVLIEVDTNNCEIIISNRGKDCKPFSSKGIKSLMVSNFSPKVTKKYIGNKGLGFRSIINWSNRIIITSQNTQLTFSREIAMNFLNSLYNEEEINEMRLSRNLPKTISPIAFLSIPKVEELIQNEWVTSINIQFKREFLDDIITQLNDIKDEILLFVKNISILRIKLDNEERIVERDKDKNQIFLNNSLWTIYESSDELPKHLWDKENESENYELKIASSDDKIIKNSLLYSYFPTKIELDFPFLVHGSFDLNSSRNDINYNEKNKFILHKLVELIIDTAKQVTEESVSYKALEFLSHNSNNITLKYLSFYENIDKAINELEIFPCLDGNYRTKNEVVFISSEFSEFIVTTGNQHLFPNMLISTRNSSIEIYKYFISKTIDEINKINILSQNIKTIDLRVELIYIVKNYFDKNPFELLIDNDNNIIALDDEVYTPVTKDYNLSIPKFTNIKFINRELYEKLLIKFTIGSTEKARELQRTLKDITNIQSYEPAQVLQKIISSTNQELKSNEVNKVDIVKKMCNSLFINFKILDGQTPIQDRGKIQLISQNNEVIRARDLFLSDSYPSGKITKYLFGSVFDDSMFLANIRIFDINDDDTELVERFFLWLGVNKYTKFSIITNRFDYKFERFIFTKIRKPSGFKDLSFQLIKIEYFDSIIQQFNKEKSYEKLLLWALLDNKIHSEIFEEKTLRYYYRTSYPLYHCPSYIVYQFSETNIFKDFLLTRDKQSKFINNIELDFSIFDSYGFNKVNIESLLLKIGAVEKFENLSIEKVEQIIMDLPVKSPDGKKSLSIYKESLEHFKKNNYGINKSGLSLCARKNMKLDYYEYDKIFYSGTIKLPKKITDTIPILNFPRRQNTKKLVEFLGINDLKKIKIDVTKHFINENLTDEFNKFYHQLAPYILVYRFEDSTTENSRKSDISNLKKSKIYLCSEVEYKLEESHYSLENNDYIVSDNEYFIKIGINQNLSNLREQLDFTETFADIIGSIFDLNETERYSRLIKDDIAYTNESIKRNIGEDELHKVKEYLGILDEYYLFWEPIYTLLGKDYCYDDDKNLLEKIKLDLNTSVLIEDIDFNDINNLNNGEYIEKLFTDLNIDIKSFNKISSDFCKIDFLEYCQKRLILHLNSNGYKFKQLLYEQCSKNGKESDFLSLLEEYNRMYQTIELNEVGVDYLDLVYSLTLNKFNIDMETSLDDEIDIDLIYEDSKKVVDFDIISDSSKYRSLLYFENKRKELIELVENLSIEESKSNPPIENNKSSLENKQIIPIELNKPTQPTRAMGSSKSYRNSHNENKKKKEIGDKAEYAVFITLRNEYGNENVEWVSKDSDSYGYDIRYRNNEGIYKYVEVKTFSGDKFYLSKKEKYFAEKNKENYEIFLVGTTIFKLTDIDFNDGEKFLLEAENYIVYYSVNDN